MSAVLKGLKSFQKTPYTIFDQDGPVSPAPQQNRSMKKSFFGSPISLKRSKSFINKKEQKNMFDFFLILPSELQFEILKFVGIKDLCNIQCVSKLMYGLATENLVWKQAFQNHWELSDTSMDTFGYVIKDWQTHFKTQFFIHQTKVIISKKVKQSENKPQPRFAHSAGVYNNHVYYIGGQISEERVNQILDYNPKQNTFSQVEISNHDPTLNVTQTNTTDDCCSFKGIDGLVPKFARHASVTIGHKIYTFGGFDYNYFSHLSAFDILTQTWTYPEVHGDAPVPRSNHAATAVGNDIYIFGGSIGDKAEKYTVTKDFYKFNVTTMTWYKLELGDSAPTERVGHVMATIGKHIYLFGGGIWGKTEGWTAQNNDMYVYSTVTNEWSYVDSPKENRPPVCTYPFVFTLKNNFCIFGGSSLVGSTVTNNLYLWDILVHKWTQLTIQGDVVSARSIGTATVIEDEIILWGGYCGGVLHVDNDMFKLKFINFPSHLSCLGSS